MPTTGTENKTRWRHGLRRALLLSVLVYVLVAATAGTFNFIAATYPHPKPAPVLSVHDFALLFQDNVAHGGVVEYCQPLSCFDNKRNVQGYRVRAL